MKKNFLQSLCLLLVAMGMASSCSDENAYLNVDETVLNQGIKSGITGACYEVKVSCNGDWSASVPEDVNWLSAIGGSEYGDGRLLIVVEANNDVNPDFRSADVTVKSGELTQIIHVKQDVPEGAGNAEGSFASFPTASSCYALGAGYDFSSSSSKQQVINMEMVKALIEQDKEGYEGFNELFNYSKYENVKAESMIVDSIETKVDTLGVHIRLNIGYNAFKFEIGGDISSGEQRHDSTFHYRTAAKYARVSAGTDLASAVSWYNERNNPEYSAYKKRLSGILNKGVRDYMAKIENAYETGDNASFNSHVDMLTNTYGTMVLTSTELGGMAYLDAVIDTAYTTSYLKVDNAQVTAKIESGLFKLEAGASVNYTKEATDILSHSFYSYGMMGGDNLPNVFNALTATKPNPEKINGELKNWMQTIDATLKSDKFNSVVVSMECTPIWILFMEDGKLMAKVKSRILATHKDDVELQKFK